MESRKPFVWIVNRTLHDYSKAKKYGTLVEITRGNVNIFHPERYGITIKDRMKEFQPDDYILVSGHTLLNLFCVEFALTITDVVHLLVYGAKLGDYRIVDWHKRFWDNWVDALDD